MSFKGTEILTKRVNNIIYGPKLEVPIDERGLGKTIFDKMQEYEDRIFQVKSNILYHI